MADAQRTLVTGGLGFVGSHLVEALLARGDELTIVDNMTSPVVAPDFFDSSCTVHVGDVADLSPADARFDRIYHLADIAGPARVLHYGGEIAHMCVSNARGVLHAARLSGARTLLVSSSEV